MIDRQGAVAGWLWGAAAVAGAQGFECAPLAPSTSRAPAYAAQAGQARCEGFFEKKVSQPFIEIVSLTRGVLPAVQPLQLRADAKTGAHLVVQPLRSGPFYRVDAALPAGQTLAWDAGPMLAATGLRLVDLGFLALLRPAAVATPVAVLAPVLLGALGAEPPPSGTPPRGPALAVVRVSVAVGSVAWRSYRLGADGGLVSGWATLPGSQLFAWQRIGVPITLPADGQRLMVDVQAVAADDGQALPLLRFAIEGGRDGGP